jgi:hypothetical protein
VIPFNGGQGGVLNSPTYLALREIFLPYQVRTLYRLPFVQSAADCFSPLTIGSAVAVEQIFSGGRDTISLRRASLKPDTIRTLMLVKQHLRLARTAIRDLLGD